MIDGSLIAFVVGGSLVLAFNAGIAWYMTFSNKKKIEKLEAKVEKHLSESSAIQRELVEIKTDIKYMREDINEIKQAQNQARGYAHG